MTRTLNFDNQFVTQFTADLETGNFPRQVENASYSFVKPKKTSKPQLVAYSQEVLDQVGIPTSFANTEEFCEIFTGNKLMAGMQPYASCYGGHQFGHWAGQLGDGRAINLGEILTTNNDRLALQLKGAGPTPYSRTADGLAVLRSSVREFLCSEAMFHLGVPTTRALSLCLSGDNVMRDMFYDGNQQWEPGAVVCRVAPSFTRFGHFELPAARGDKVRLQQLIDFTIKYDFPHLDAASPDVYAQWFEEICVNTADMIVHWMRVGFVHGVMNTDNMSILGLTIDYGPYGWLEDYDPGWTPNTTDAQGKRYSFANQAQIGGWNLTQLANALHVAIPDEQALQSGLESYSNRFNSQWQLMMANKLGLDGFNQATDEVLIQDLLSLLQTVETDMTLFYRQLARMDLSASAAIDRNNLPVYLAPAYYMEHQVSPAYIEKLHEWLGQYQQCLHQRGVQESERTSLMNNTNPKFVLRNYLAQLAIDDATNGDFSMVNELLDVLRHPYDEQQHHEEDYAQKRPEWARHRAGCSQLSCSS